MTTNAYLVLGPESSGTRLMTRILIQAGCLGSDDHDQAFDQALPAADGRPIVWRRSVPHRREWPDIGLLVRLLREQGYEPQAVVMARDWYATARSQLDAGHVADIDMALANLQQAYQHIYQRVSHCYVLVTYEGLVQRPIQTLAWLMPMLGLPVPQMRIYDANAKWYKFADLIPWLPGETVP
jgi:LPS sulfotransferase NodH